MSLWKLFTLHSEIKMINHRQLFLQHVAQTSQAPLALHIVRADGCFLYDDKGKEYIDLIAGISVCNLGHNNSAINEAVKKQIEQYSHIMVYGELIESPQTLFASLLASHLPPNLNCTYFVNSGTEAIEGAMKLAKRTTGRNEIVALTNSYHGSTQGSLSLMSNEYFSSAFRPLIPGVKFIDPTKPDFDVLNENTSCIIMELVKAEEGCKPLTYDFVNNVVRICREKNILLVVDECQTGLGRTGKSFAFENYDIIPDILVLGKALGGGMPLGAFISSKKTMDKLTHNPVLGHITTFGGHPVCCAAGMAAFAQLTEQKLYDNVEVKEMLFRKLLKHPKIKSVSGKGLLLALEFESEKVCLDTIRKCIDNGLFTDWFLFAPNCLRIAPPLTISNQLIERSCEILLNALND